MRVVREVQPKTNYPREDSNLASWQPILFDPTNDGRLLSKVRPLTMLEKEVWSAHMYSDASACSLGEIFALKITGPLNLLRLRRAIEQAAAIIPSFHSTVDPFGRFLCIHNDLRPDIQIDENPRALSQIKEKISQFASKPFVLHQDCLVRYDIQKTIDGDTVLAQISHHIAADGWSSIKAFEMILAIYDDTKNIEELRKLINHKSTVISSACHDTINRWKKRLEYHHHSLNLPRKSSKERTFTAKTHYLTLDAEITSTLRNKAAKRNTSLMTYLLSAFHWTCSDFCSQAHVAIGVPFASQLVHENHWLLGHHTSLLPSTTTLDSATDFDQCVSQVKESLIFARENINTSIAELVSALDIPRSHLTMPIVNVVFNFDPDFTIPMVSNDSSIVSVPKNFETYEIFICVIASETSIDLEFSYDTSIYAEDTIRSLADKFKLTLKDSFSGTLRELRLEPRGNVSAPAAELNRSVHRNSKNEEDKNSAENKVSLPNIPEVKTIESIWKDFLQVDQLEVDDDFFLLGGHSLLAAQIIAKVNDELSLKLRVNDLLKHSSFESFVESCLGLDLRNQIDTATSKGPTSSTDQTCNLSSLQRQMWLTEHMFPATKDSLHLLPSAWHLKGNEIYEKLSAACKSFVSDQDLLRARFPGEDISQLRCILSKLDESPLVLIDHRDKKTSVQSVIEDLQNRQIKFDITQGPLFSMEFHLINSGEGILFFAAHHMIWDGWCFDIFLEYLDRHLRDQKPHVPSLTYNDCINADLNRQKLGHENYWLERLQPLPDPLELPTDYARPAIFEFTANHHLFRISEKLTNQIEILAKTQRTTSFNVLLSAYSLLLALFSKQDDLIVAIPNRRREHPGEEHVIGPFISNLPIRIKVDHDQSLAEYIREIHSLILTDFDHTDLSIDDLIGKLKITRNESRNQLFASQFSYQDTRNRPNKLGDFDSEQIFIPHGSLATDLLIWVKREKNDLCCGFDYYSKLWHFNSIKSFEKCLVRLLEIMTQKHSQTIRDFSFYDSAYLPAIRFDEPRYSWENLFIDQIKTHPENIALSFLERRYSYQELHESVLRRAGQLKNVGVKPQQFVGVAMNRSDELIITIIAILRLGAAYIPLDPKFPPERLSYMIEQSEMSRLIYDQHPFTFCDIPQNHFEEGRDLGLKEADLIRPSLSDPAYVIYTSGSTGKPKGVVISHRALSNFLSQVNKRFELDSNDRLLAITTISFDISVLEIFLPLTVGAQVDLSSTDDALDGYSLIRKIEKGQPSWLQATPATWTMLLQAGWQGASDLNIITGGEPLSLELGHKLASCSRAVWNAYGPTEATVWATLAKIDETTARIHIGEPIENYAVLLLDDKLNPAPAGYAARLYLAGPSLASCYLHREDLTRERFVRHPGLKDQIIYDTGDLARLSGNGELTFLGRRDSQVKVRGFRIELGEIESAILTHDEVSQVAVIVREDSPGDQKLVAYIKGVNNLKIASLNKFLSAFLPRYMLPNTLVHLEKFPLTGSGKIDRKALPKPNLGPPPAKTLEPKVLSMEERWLVENWTRHTGTTDIIVSDNFFSLGGHSVAAVQCLVDIKQHFEVHLEIRDLMTATLENIAAKIHNLSNSDAGSAATRVDTHASSLEQKNSSLWSKIVGRSKR